MNIRHGAPALLLLLFALADVRGQQYDPLDLGEASSGDPVDLAAHDSRRDRDVPLRVYLPTENKPAPVILFSHGLGGSRAGGAYLGEHWSARGYAVVSLQHPGSDSSVWKDQPRRKRMAALEGAASGQNFLLRVQDVSSALDQLAAWNKEDGHPVHGRLDMEHVGMSGHSFGAVTTQSVSGQSAGFMGARFTDDRIDAAIAFSPSSPRRGDPAKAFSTVKIPWMLMTGTKDTSPIGNSDVPSRLAVYPNLPQSIDKYELVLHGAVHSAFTDRMAPGDADDHNPNHHRAILALSTAFWDTYLRSDPAARQWLLGSGPQSVLEKEDRWQRSSEQ